MMLSVRSVYLFSLFKLWNPFVCTCDFSRAFFGRPHKIMSFKNIFFSYKY